MTLSENGHRVNVKNPLLFTRILSISMLLAILFYAIIIYQIFPEAGFQIYSKDSPVLLTMTIILAAAAIWTLRTAYYLPKRLSKLPGMNNSRFISSHLIRITLVQAVAIYGLILGVIGAAWYVSAPFLVVSAGLLVVSFPNKEKLDNFTNKQDVH